MTVETVISRQLLRTDHFPSQARNQWLYQCTLGCSAADTMTVAVTGTAMTVALDGSRYYVGAAS